MTKCPACSHEYNEREHLEMYDVTTKENLAKYLAYSGALVDE
ncbi:MAG: hypothetical protein WBZ36_08565 [Candidatus Nitrosopolaris sp.]